jgi:hypothetical protein
MARSVRRAPAAAVAALLFAAALAAAAAPAAAVIGTVDAVPAATLLLPYFEVDLDDPLGVTTLFSINNASATAQLAHVTVWSTWSIPVLDFDVYLTGYDIQTFNLRDLLVDGVLPQTGAGTTTAANDPGSPLGLYSFPHVAFPNCNNSSVPPQPPVYAVPGISVNFRTHLRALLTGRQSPVNGTCAGANLGDNIARGYVTIDDVNSCSQLFPSDVGYFAAGGTGIADNDNVLWGDAFYVFCPDFAQGEPLVHVEAETSTATPPGTYTFYGRYVGGLGSDNREPLATTFASRYLSGVGFDAGTDLLVWRDSKFPPGASCVTGPNYGELFEQQIVVFDELENPLTVVTGGPSGEPTPGAQCTFCDEAQRVAVGDGGITTNGDFGWLYLNLNHATTNDGTLGPGYVNVAQAWVTTVHTAAGAYSVGYSAVQLDNARTAPPGGVTLPVAP